MKPLNKNIFNKFLYLLKILNLKREIFKFLINNIVHKITKIGSLNKVRQKFIA